MMRFLVVGAGAIGGGLAVDLARSGHDVAVVARGAHLDAIRAHGLVRHSPEGTTTTRLVAHATVGEAVVDEATVVVVATKVQQAEPVLDALLVHAGPDVPVVCAHNGVEGERLALRRFRTVLAANLNIPGTHLQPGVIDTFAARPRGVLDVGRVPAATDGRSDPVAVVVAERLTDAGYLSEACADIGPRKWAKLIGNTGNALQVLCGRPSAGWDRLYEVVRAEAEAVVAAAGIAVDHETQQARSAQVARGDIGDRARSGSSTWQSVERGTGDVEVVALNGEISLLGRLHGVPTPANDLVVARTLALVAAPGPTARLDQDALLAEVHAADADRADRSTSEGT